MKYIEVDSTENRFPSGVQVNAYNGEPLVLRCGGGGTTHHRC